MTIIEMSSAPPTRPAISASRDAEVECERERKRRKEIKGRVKRKLIQKVKKKRKLIIQKIKKSRGKGKKREEKNTSYFDGKIKE